MSELPTPPAGFKIANQPDLVSEIPEGWTVVEDRPTPPAGFVYPDEQPKESKAYQSVILPTRIDDEGGMHWAVPGLIQGVWDAVTLPGEVAAGQVDMNSPEAQERAFGLATMMVGARVPRITSATLADEFGKPAPRAVMKALQRDGVSIDDVSNQVKELGPGAVLADLGPNVGDLAAAVATRPGAGQRTIVDTLMARREAAPDRLTRDVDEILGIAPVPSALNAEVKANQRVVGPLYDQALANAAPVDTSGIAAHLDNLVPELRGPAQAALQNVRSMLDVTGQQQLDDRATTLFEVRRAVDGMLDGELDGNVKRVLGDARRQIDETLTASAPGIKEIDARYAELSRQRDAIDRGQTVLGNSRTDPRPVELAQEVAQGALPAGEIIGPSGVAHRLRQGARAEIDRIVGTNLNDRAALNSLLKGSSDWNYDRLVTLFGKERTDQLYRVLENERVMATTENKALAGAKTASVQAAQDEIVAAATRPAALRSMMDLKAGTAMADIISAVLRKPIDAWKSARNRTMADVLMGNGSNFAETAMPNIFSKDRLKFKAIEQDDEGRNDRRSLINLFDLR